MGLPPLFPNLNSLNPKSLISQVLQPWSQGSSSLSSEALFSWHKYLGHSFPRALALHLGLHFSVFWLIASRHLSTELGMGVYGSGTDSGLYIITMETPSYELWVQLQEGGTRGGSGELPFSTHTVFLSGCSPLRPFDLFFSDLPRP